MAFIILILFSFVITFMLLQWRRNRAPLYALSQQLPGPPPYPLIGNALEFNIGQEELLVKMGKFTSKYTGNDNKAIRFWFGPKIYIYVSSAAHIEKIMFSPKMTHKDYVYTLMEEYIGKGLISGSGPRWRSHRKFVAPMFNAKWMTGYMKIFHDEALTLVDILRPLADGHEFDVYKYYDHATADVVAATLMDVKLDAQRNGGYCFSADAHSYYTITIERMMKIWLHPYYLYRLSALAVKQRAAVKNLQTFVMNALADLRKNMTKRKENQEYETPLVDQSEHRNISTLEMMLTGMEADPNAYTDQELIDEMITLFLASSDTTATICSFIVLLLGAYPEYQDRVYKEISSIGFHDGSTPLTYSELNRLQFTERVIKDVLRLFPIAPFVGRQCTEYFQLDDDLAVPKDASIVIGIHDVHRQHQHWEHPNEFYPDHFLPEKVAARHPGAYLPFTLGLRGCLGKLYANLCIKIMIVETVMNFRIESDRRVPEIPLKTYITVRPIGGYKIRLFPRNINDK